ncbi:MAG: phosphomannomutase/phosphoglucomutase, partial [Parcubacteria group bacterium]|nr:phosphomannomutase/phosphoglucomutase [Parcubacteria group bacterium]
VMVTASHNPSQYNGLKLSIEEAVSAASVGGIDAIRDIACSEKEFLHEGTGVATPIPMLDAYITYLVGRTTVKNPVPVALDTGNGMTGYVLPKLCSALRIPYTPLFFELDGSFPNHEANPIKTETLESLREVIRKKNMPFGVAFDGDGDRIGFVTEDGELVRPDFIAVLIARELLRKLPGAKILSDSRSSRVFLEEIQASGGVPLRGRSGYIFIRKRMKEEGIIFAAELSGHYFFQDFFYCDSTMIPFLLVMEILSASGKTLKELIDPFKERYVQSGEINFPVSSPEPIFACLEEAFADGECSKEDGLRVEYSDWWFDLRLANTEPLIRLNAEAKDRNLLEEKLRLITACIEKAKG